MIRQLRARLRYERQKIRAMIIIWIIGETMGMQNFLTEKVLKSKGLVEASQRQAKAMQSIADDINAIKRAFNFLAEKINSDTREMSTQIAAMEKQIEAIAAKIKK